MNLFLLSAGEGTRLRPYTLTLPKPAIPFLNVPMAYYSLSLAKSLSPSRVIVNTFHLPEKIRSLFSKESLEQVGWKTPIHFSNEGERIRGSGGALAYARVHAPSAININNDTLLMNGDELTLPSDPEVLEKAYMQHMKEQNLATLITMSHPEAGKKFGAVWTQKSHRVVGFGKTSPQPGLIPQHYVGAMFLSPRIFDHLIYDGCESNILYDDVTRAMAEGEKIQAYPIDCSWQETGNPADYLAATKTFLNLYESSLSLQTLIRDYAPMPQELIHQGSSLVLKPKSLSLPSNLQVDGFAVMGASVKEGTRIKDSVILSPTGEHEIIDTIVL